MRLVRWVVSIQPPDGEVVGGGEAFEQKGLASGRSDGMRDEISEIVEIGGWTEDLYHTLSLF